jgi:steroid delta-isomerase-like uncharacterized protein
MDMDTKVREFHEAVSGSDLDHFGELMADDFIEHEETPGFPPTKEGVLQSFGMYRSAFPDMRMEVEEILLSGDKAVVRVRASGTQQGEFMGMPASGKAFDVPIIDIIRFGDDGLAHEHWGLIDTLTMMQQLGAVPEGPPA